MIALLLTLFTHLCWAEPLTLETLSRTEKKLVHQITEKITPFVKAINQHASKQGSSYQLARADLDMAISIEAGLLVFSKSHERSIELVWQRNEAQKSALEEEIEVTVSSDVEQVAKSMITQIQHRLGERWSNTRVRQKIIRTIYRDARRINRYILSIANFNARGESDG